jgi:hypothetical protein
MLAYLCGLVSEDMQVLKNELGAVAGTTQGFSLTPPAATTLGGASPVFTASKVMLAKEETQMNMLTPITREAVVQVRHSLSPWETPCCYFHQILFC